MKTARILKLLMEARRTATMEDCGFSNIVIVGKEPFHPKDTTIQELTRLWRETWIIGPLDEAIQLLKVGK